MNRRRRTKFEIHEKLLNKLIKEIKKMAKNLEETMAAVKDLRDAVTEQLEETKNLIAAVEKLLTAVPPSGDLQPLFDEVVAAKDALKGDNAEVQAELDKVNPPPTA
jgi:uncharacterized protein YoxC